MKTSFWRRWCNSLRRAKPARPVSRARPRRQRLCLEALEDRVTPSLTPQMVLDIGVGSSNPSQLVAIGSTTYFTADDGVHGVELWKTDGTAAGTVLVKDIFTGGSSYPSNLTNVSGTLFFTAREVLWKSDGTDAGTVPVSPLGLHPSNFTDANGTLFFSQYDYVNGQELWKSDGTAAGTVLVKDIFTGGSSSPGNLTNVNGTLFFTADDGTGSSSLWQSDGTEAGTALVTNLSASWLTNGNGTLYFSADDGVHGSELWVVPPDGPSPLAVCIYDATVAEGHSGTQTAAFTVTLSAASTQTVTVAYATGNGTSTAGSDYQAASGTLTFAPGEISKTVTVLVNGDRLAEPNETFVVNLSNPTNAVIADGHAVGTIADDEPRISISDVTKSEGRRNKKTLFTFTVTLSAAYDQAVTMSFRTVDGTATTSDSDYLARTGTLTFAPGETTKTITIEVKGDSKREANEYFYLDLFGLSGNALFTKNRGLGTILDDE
jgi:ELWxxDGT repeat protein